MRFGRLTAALAAALVALIVALPVAAIPPVPFVKDYDMGAITGGQREESITVDPNNPDHVAAGANERGIGSTQTWYISTDGGRTFANGILPNGTLTVPGTTSTLMSDPSLDFGSNGEIYYSALMHGNTGEPCTLFVSETANNGTNWTDPANGIIGAGSTSPTVCQDKEMVAVDRGHNDNVYAAWTPQGGTNDQLVVFSRDLNGVSDGFAFSAETVLSTLGAGQNAGCLNQGADFALTGNDLYVAWTSFCSGFGDNDAATVYVTHSTNQGGSWSAPVAAATLNNVDFTSLGFRSRSFPSIDVDPVTGRVFVVYGTYAGSGSDAEVMLVSSGNNGTSWTSPTRVNQDSGTSDQWMPWVAVGNGRVNVAFYSRADDGNINAHVAYGAVAASPSFTDIRVSSASTPTTSGFLGDYNGNFVGSDDVVHPSWADARSGLSGTDAFTARVNFSPPQAVTAAPPTQSPEVGTTATVTAHVTGLNGENETFIPVAFSVSGVGSPTPSTGSGVTGMSGTVGFAFTNTTSGLNTVHVWADLDENGTEDSGEAVNVTVNWQPGPPASLTLTPATDTNTVDDTHTVTAEVRDQFGNLVNPVLVRFSVSGANGIFGIPTSGSSTTSGGHASFSYVGPMPGNDTITAFADFNGDGTRDPNPAAHEPQGTAAKTWTLPPSTAGKFNGGGKVERPSGFATFGLSFKGLPTLGGNLEYQDHSSASARRVVDLTVDAYVQNGSSVKIFGTATIDGAGNHVFRLDLVDKGEPGTADTFRLRIDDGYDTGVMTLASGNLQAH